MATEHNKSKLNKLMTHKVWKSGGEGVQKFIVKRMNLLLTTILQDIGHVLGKDPKAQLLANMCLNASVTFLTQLMAFVDSSYEKLLASSQFSVEQAWSLTIKILDRICEDSAVVRAQGGSGHCDQCGGTKFHLRPCVVVVFPNS